MTLSRRLLLLMLAVLLPTAALITWIVGGTYLREADNEGRRLRETVRALALVVDRELDKRAAVARTLAASTVLGEGDHRRFHDEARVATRATDDWVVLVDLENELIDTSVPIGTPLPKRSWGADQPLVSGAPQVSNLHINPVTKEPVLVMFAPVAEVYPPHFNVGVSFTPAALQAILRQQALPQGWQAAIVDRDGVVVAHTDAERWLGRRAPSELGRALNREAEGALDMAGLGGVDLRAWYSRSPLYGWTVMIGVPGEAISTAARAAALQAAWGAAVLAVLAVALAMWGASRIRRPIEALERAAAELAQERVPTVPPTGLAEADAVGAALHRAGVQAAQINEELERRVAAALSDAREAHERHEALARVLAEELLTLITDHLPVLISYVDRQTRYRLNNLAYERWFGRPRSDITGRLMSEVSGEENWRKLAPRMDAALRGEPVAWEEQLHYPAVGLRWVEISYVPHRGQDGQVAGVAILVHDITARRRDHEELTHRESQLRESRNVLSLAMRGGRMGAWSRDLATDRVWWSIELEEIYGLPPGGFGGDVDAFHALVHPEDDETQGRAVEQAIQTGSDYATEFRFRHASGEWRWMEGRGRAVYGSDGRPTMLYGLGIDITDRKRAEDELRRLNDELALAHRRKDEFLATLAHELRNPLAPITSALQVLRLKQAIDPRLRGTQEVIERQVRQLIRLVDDLLDVARIQRGRVELRRERVDLGAIVQGAVEAANPVVAQAQHTLEVSLPDTPVWLEADPTRLVQVVLNLLHNAAKYTPEGGRIAVLAGIEQGQAVVRVRDNGIGIAPEHLTGVFEMFSQVAPAIERSQGGLGIGLALVRGLVQLHGGRIEAHSDGPGRGSEFVVVLPLAADAGPTSAGASHSAARPTPRGVRETATDALHEGVDAAATASAAPAHADASATRDASGPAEPAVPAKPLRVMVVDDNRDAAISLAALLELGGHETVVAHDGPAALAVADAFRPQLALLDIGMPGMNGYELAQRLRAGPRGQAMTLAALTGWGQQDDKRRAMEAGFDRHLTKPVDDDALNALIDEVRARPDREDRRAA